MAGPIDILPPDHSPGAEVAALLKRLRTLPAHPTTLFGCGCSACEWLYRGRLARTATGDDPADSGGVPA